MALEIGAWFRRLFGKVEEPKHEDERRVGGEMSAKEAGELASAGLSGKGPEYTDGFTRNRTEDKPQKEKKKDDNLAGKIVAGLGFGVAIAGAILGGGIPLILGGAVVGLLGLSSCTKPNDNAPDAYIYHHDEVNQNVTVENDYSPLLIEIQLLRLDMNNGFASLNEKQQRIIDLIEQLLSNQTENHAALINYLADILHQVQQMDENNQEFYLQVLDALELLRVQNEAQFNQLMAKLDALDANLASYFFNLMGTIVNQGENLSGKIDELIQQMTQAQAKLDVIIGLLENLDIHMQAGFSALLQQIASQGGDIMAFLEGIMSLLQQIKVQVQQGNQQNQQLLQQILGQLSNLNANLQAGIAQILAKLDQMDANQQQGVLNILNMLAHMDQNQQAGVQAILDAINNLSGQFLGMFGDLLAKLDHIEANQMTQIQQLADILAAIQAGNANMEQITNLIANLNLGTDVNLDVIEGLLRQILAQVQNNGQTLNMIHTTAQTLQAQMAQVINNQDILNEWAEAIFNKIQACNCEDCCEQLINILIQIDQHIQDMDWNHEGIDDELGNLLGK